MKKTVCKKNFESIRDAKKFGKKELRKIQGGAYATGTLCNEEGTDTRVDPI